MPITVPLSPAPSRAAPATFSPRMDTVLSELGTFVTEANALETNVNNLEIAAGVHATTATDQAVIATAQAVAAAASASSASLAANVVKWVSGTTYTEGAVVWSPTNYAGYRRKTTGAGTTDPSADPTNWVSATLSAISAVPAADTWTGPVITLTAHENMALGQLCFINSSGEAALADADAAATMPGCVMATAATSADAAGVFILPGTVIHLHTLAPGWTVGGVVYAGSGATSAHTAGAINQGDHGVSGHTHRARGQVDRRNFAAHW